MNYAQARKDTIGFEPSPEVQNGFVDHRTPGAFPVTPDVATSAQPRTLGDTMTSLDTQGGSDAESTGSNYEFHGSSDLTSPTHETLDEARREDHAAASEVKSNPVPDLMESSTMSSTTNTEGVAVEEESSARPNVETLDNSTSESARTSSGDDELAAAGERGTAARPDQAIVADSTAPIPEEKAATTDAVTDAVDSHQIPHSVSISRRSWDGEPGHGVYNTVTGYGSNEDTSNQHRNVPQAAPIQFVTRNHVEGTGIYNTVTGYGSKEHGM
ncbi:hypothetical protein BX600DRAFT_467765 [Xylariales sp. PMI_506]|nr:hypothetical protein BX600DRAFT_467765 [Xylariales sp. PMI_506]